LIYSPTSAETQSLNPTAKYLHLKNIEFENFKGCWNKTQDNPMNWSYEELFAFKQKFHDLYNTGFRMSQKYPILFANLEHLSIYINFIVDENYLNLQHLEQLKVFKIKVFNDQVYDKNQEKLKQLITSLMISKNGL